MEKQHNSSGGGFFVGLLVGAVAGALVSTKKGRQILKELADYGVEYAGDIVNLDGVSDILKDEEATMSGEMESSAAEEVSEKEEKPKKRRLFKGLKKK